ncbi:hypothetical protein CYMTET_45977 [Cymbomonas tetramitiformis]|uniref:Fe2OG dioxygenase domain-containing protein n=1 Tax=Cymbomonas tetramitiformis TaxID=36881 RepID=A0AAE0BZ50_9CHLO|nr:hypothetical protein CYMTET_45977 [Cymbomonas tetramitiformis]
MQSKAVLVCKMLSKLEAVLVWGRKMQSKAVPVCVVLLRGWLTLDQQIEFVANIRELGMGNGGFYTPSYGDGARLSLQMMCLGKHWDPRSGKYEEVRTQYDGAAPPPMPLLFLQTAQAALGAAREADQQAGKGSMPDMRPEICLVNFYPPSGKLGMHQDKSESARSLQRGAPVLSLSIGDSADFHYSMDSREDMRARVVLESGDLLVFGGPARLLYHGVPTIHPKTAPPALVTRTGLRPGRLNLTFREFKD